MRIECRECGSGAVKATYLVPDRVWGYECIRCGKTWWVKPKERELTPGLISRMGRLFGEMVIETEKEKAHGATCAGNVNSADQNCAASDTAQAEEILTKKGNQQQSQSEEPGEKAFLHLHEAPEDVRTESQMRIHTLTESSRKK